MMQVVLLAMEVSEAVRDAGLHTRSSGHSGAETHTIGQRQGCSAAGYPLHDVRLQRTLTFAGGSAGYGGLRCCTEDPGQHQCDTGHPGTAHHTSGQAQGYSAACAARDTSTATQCPHPVGATGAGAQGFVPSVLPQLLQDAIQESRGSRHLKPYPAFPSKFAEGAELLQGPPAILVDVRQCASVTMGSKLRQICNKLGLQVLKLLVWPPG